MDLDAYAAAHGHEWTELEALARRRRLTGPEADRLVTLYQSGAAELSALQTAAGPSVVADRLNKVEGVLATETHIAFRAYSRHDLESAFSLGLD